MKRILFFIILIYCSSVIKANGQIIDKMLRQIKAYKTISYIDSLKYQASFDMNSSVNEFRSQIMLVPNESQTGGFFRVKGNQTEYLFDGNKCVTLDLSDSTYKITNKIEAGQNARTLLYWIKKFTPFVATASKIKQLTDTSINHTAYYHILISAGDSIINNRHTYSHYYLVLDKKTCLPLSIKQDIQGFTETGAFVGIIEDHNYSGYKFNEKTFPDLSSAMVPANFKLPVITKSKPLLTKGEKAPEIGLYDISGNLLQPQKTKGKIILVNFTVNGCPHCVESIEMLNKLHDQYSSSIAILDINVSDTKENIVAFNKKFKANYTTYINGKSVAEAYHISGYPTFYLIDKQGNIANSFEGFYPALEKEIREAISKL